MNNLAQSIYSICIELQNMLNHDNYKEFGQLQRAAKSLFQYAFENEIIQMKKELCSEHYEETFHVVGYNEIFGIGMIGLEYQEKQ